MGSDDKIAEELIDQVCMLAADAAEVRFWISLAFPLLVLHSVWFSPFHFSVDIQTSSVT